LIIDVSFDRQICVLTQPTSVLLPSARSGPMQKAMDEEETFEKSAQ
jgi:hypothetical protein